MEIQIPSTNLKRVVIIGGGFAGVNVAKKLRNKNFQVVLLDKNNYHLFQPLLYQVATGGLEAGSIAFPIRKILKDSANTFFRVCEVTSVDRDKNEIMTNLGTLKYDYLVVATGSNTNYFGLENFRKNSLPMKSIPEALEIRNIVLENFEEAIEANDNAERDALINFVIVGGGPTGVELAGAFSEMRKYVLPDDYPELNFMDMHIYLFEAGDRLLAGMSKVSSARALNYLTKMKVKVMLNERVADYDGNNIRYGDNKTIGTKTVIWTAGVQGMPVDGLPEGAVLKNKRVKVNENLLLEGAKNIFVIGDAASVTSDKMPNGYPMLAPVAIQQGKYVAKFIINTEINKSQVSKPFKYFDKGVMATLGRNHAVAESMGFKLGGWIAWQAWLWIHLMFLIGFRNKLVVLLDWLWNYITYDRAVRLIIRPIKSNPPKN